MAYFVSLLSGNSRLIDIAPAFWYALSKSTRERLATPIDEMHCEAFIALLRVPSADGTARYCLEGVKSNLLFGLPLRAMQNGDRSQFFYREVPPSEAVEILAESDPSILSDDHLPRDLIVFRDALIANTVTESESQPHQDTRAESAMIASLPGPAHNACFPKTECEKDVMFTISKAKSRLTTAGVLKAMEKTNKIHGESTIKTALSRAMSIGQLDNCSKCNPRGYGLPAWNCEHAKHS